MVLKDMHVRENLTMDSGTTTFTNRRGYLLSFTTLLLLGAFFICTLVAVSFIVYNFATCAQLNESNLLNVIASSKSVTSESTQRTIYNHDIKINGISKPTDSKYNTNETMGKLKNDLRLPRSVIPLKYNISLIPFLFEGNFTFHGDVQIHVIIIEECTNITLHAANLIIQEDDIAIRLIEKNELPIDMQTMPVAVPIKNQSFITSKQFFIIEFDEILKPNAEYVINIKFKGHINDYLQGFYRSSYIGANGEKWWLASTQFQPTDARQAFPCFDEPALKANFTLNIARLKNMTTISNMPQIKGPKKEVDGLPLYVWDSYQESVPMSTYLVAFTVSNFVKESIGDFSVWARPSAINSAKYALNAGNRILKFLEKYFNIPFPLPKMDMIALPDFSAGAMENWGLITYRETTMLFEEGVSGTVVKPRIASVVGHELAHQWFGNLVTPSWWSDVWLNEGFANYMEYITVDAIEPQWKTMDQFVVNEIQNVFLLDALSSSHKISVEVGNPEEINEIFDKISYGKGATIIRMMSHFLTSDVFRMGLSEYLREMAYKSAEQDDLWRYLTNKAHEFGMLDSSTTVKEIMDTWTLQTGYPVVKISLDSTSHVLRLEQERFVFAKATKNSNATDPLWWIPVSYTTSKELDFQNTRPSNWIPRTKIYDIENRNLTSANWYIFNIQQTGYYRVSYDEKNWIALTKNLIENRGAFKIVPPNRAQLIDDALNLARAGYLNYSTALNLTKYLRHETDFVPWKSAIMSFNFIDSMFLRNGDYHLLKNYLISLISNLYNQVGFEDDRRDQNDMLTLNKRIEILTFACHLGHRHCIDQSVKHFQNWMFEANPDSFNPVSPNLRGIVYCYAIEYGTESEWDFAFERYLKSNVSTEKETILGSLGCSKEPWILSRYMSRVLSGESIRKQDAFKVFASVSNNVVGQQIAFDFVRSHWKELKSFLSSPFTLHAILKYTTRHMNTNFQQNELMQFIKNEMNNDIGRTIQQALEEIQVNIDWMEQNYKSIVNWLQEVNKQY